MDVKVASESQGRRVYLVIQRQPLFKAHWALFLPSTDDTTVGSKIHATGDALNGFEVTFEDDFALDTASSSQLTTLLGNVRPTEDSDALSTITKYAAAIPPPGPSPRPSSTSGSKDCQTWLRDVVSLLVKEGVLLPLSLDVVDQAPKK